MQKVQMTNVKLFCLCENQTDSDGKVKMVI